MNPGEKKVNLAIELLLISAIYSLMYVFILITFQLVGEGFTLLGAVLLALWFAAAGPGFLLIVLTTERDVNRKKRIFMVVFLPLKTAEKGEDAEEPLCLEVDHDQP